MRASNSHTGEAETGGPQGWHTGEVETGGPLGLLTSPSSQSYRLHVQGDAGSKTKMQRKAKREEPDMYLSSLYMSTQPCIPPSTHPCPQEHMQTPCTQTHTKECSPYVVVNVHIIDFDCIYPVTLFCMLLSYMYIIDYDHLYPMTH